MRSASSGVSMRTFLSSSMPELLCTGVFTPTGGNDSHCTHLHSWQQCITQHITSQASQAQNGLATFSYSDSSRALQIAMTLIHCIRGQAGLVLSRITQTAADLPSSPTLICLIAAIPAVAILWLLRKRMHLLRHMCCTCMQESESHRADVGGCTDGCRPCAQDDRAHP